MVAMKCAAAVRPLGGALNLHLRPAVVATAPRRAIITRAEEGSKSENKKPLTKSDRRIQEVDKMLKDLAINKSTAKQVLKMWRKAGAGDAAGFRRMLLKKGAERSGAVAAQLAVDASSALIAWYSGYSLATSRAMGPFTVASEFVVYTLAMYLTINATLDIFQLVAVGVATRRYSAGSVAFLEAVETLAGPASGLDVVDKARKAVVTVQVLKALELIFERLKVRAGDSGNEGDFMRDLGAYMVLLKASEAGFDPESAGVTATEAAEVAAEFSEADANDDGKIDIGEFRRMCERLAPGMSDDQLYAALSVLDTNGDGSVDFEEFLAWWRRQDGAKVAFSSPQEQTLSP